jgi:hypothetical protein
MWVKHCATKSNSPDKPASSSYAKFQFNRGGNHYVGVISLAAIPVATFFVISQKAHFPRVVIGLILVTRWSWRKTFRIFTRIKTRIFDTGPEKPELLQR